MLYTLEAVKANIRNREGKRVFFLEDRDSLTPSARDWLQHERIDIRPAKTAQITRYRLSNGETMTEKPEHLTHLRGNILISKTAPIIEFRGAMDTFEAELLLAQLAVDSATAEKLQQILTLARNIVRWEVMEEPAQTDTLCGLTLEEQRSHSHRPQDFYGQPHFMPSVCDGAAILQLNRVRCAARTAERAAAKAFEVATGGCARPDILQLLNRISSMLYILMIQLKADQSKGGRHG